MPHRLRKIRKKRGTRTQGWGRVGQHRRTGSKGRRNPGRHKALWSYVIKYEPDYFSKVGFTSPKSLRYEAKTINVGTLDGIAVKLSTEKQEDKPVVDLKALGYTKLLGTGKITKPLIIKVASCSKSATEKVKNAGGQVLMEIRETGE
ncbi:MAG: uL15 family ribosomal protein [Candidatus Bathyarchaeia archaeon]|jgi:large subunit ribosomal protein L15